MLPTLRRNNTITRPRVIDDDFLGSILDDFWGAEKTANKKTLSNFHAATDIVEKDGNIIVKTELPAVKKEDIDLKFENEYLTIKGVKKSEINEEEKGKHYLERIYGEFSRSFKINKEVDAEKISATLKDGVLSVTLPMTDPPEPEAKHIQIE